MVAGKEWNLSLRYSENQKDLGNEDYQFICVLEILISSEYKISQAVVNIYNIYDFSYTSLFNCQFQVFEFFIEKTSSWMFP